MVERPFAGRLGGTGEVGEERRGEGQKEERRIKGAALVEETRVT